LNKKILFLSAIIVLSLVFFGAISLFKNQQSIKADTLADTNQSAITRLGAPTKGAIKAKVTIVEFFDPACETCAQFYPVINGLIKKYPGKIKVEMRYTPFHQGSDQVVKILEAAHSQNKCWPALEILFANQQGWTRHHVAQPNKALMLLAPLGLNLQQLNIDIASEQIDKIVKQDIDDAKRLNVRATPEFYVNGKPLPSFDYQQLVQSVENAIAQAY